MAGVVCIGESFSMSRVPVGALLLALLSGVATMAQTSTESGPILMDGHVHITNRVYWEGIDPWQTQKEPTARGLVSVAAQLWRSAAQVHAEGGCMNRTSTLRSRRGSHRRGINRTATERHRRTAR